MAAKNQITIVDYGVGNLYSVAYALHTAANSKIDIKISARAQDVAAAQRIVLPGQGSCAYVMRRLYDSDLLSAILTAARQKPLLAICVGEQILFDQSAEGNVAGLHLLPGEVLHFDQQHSVKVPHMGWNRVMQNAAHFLWRGIPNESYFYFAHSYYARPKNPQHILAQTVFGTGSAASSCVFASAVAYGNIFATQFHPEKSAHMGLQLCRNFIDWSP